jgi:hypothetical protein
VDTQAEPYTDAAHTSDYPPHQLLPQVGGRYVTILHGPPGTDVGNLACDLEPVQEGTSRFVVTHSGWRATDEHLAQLAGGAHVRLSVWQHPIPPLAVTVEPPVCGCHGESMEWSTAVDGGSGAYVCMVEADKEPQPKTPYDQAKEEFKPGPVESNDDD